MINKIILISSTEPKMIFGNYDSSYDYSRIIVIMI